MKTGFISDEHTRHEARIAQLHHERMLAEGEDTWKTQLNAQYAKLVAATDPGEVIALACGLRHKLLTMTNEVAAKAAQEEEEAKAAQAEAAEVAPEDAAEVF